MFQQAERFTRNTVLPLVSRFTPRFITNMFNPRPRDAPRYIPFSGGDPTVNTPTVRLNEPGRNKRNQRFNPPPTIKVDTDEDTTTTTTTEASTMGSYIQKIPKRKKA
nr:unnamed protein product [Callosobruchus analis]